MERIRLLLLCVIIMAGGYTRADNVMNFRSLDGDTQFSFIEVLNTSVPFGGPILLKRGTTVKFECSFNAPYICQKVEVKCHLIINGIPMPLTFQGSSFSFGMLLPLVQGQFYDCCISIPILTSLPALACKLRIELHTKDGEKLIAGADMDVKIQ